MLVLGLLIAVFGLIPVADAAFCALDDTASHLSSAIDADGEEPRPDSGMDPGHCEHGHCHHGSLLLSLELQPARDSLHPVARTTGHQLFVSHLPDGLKRPPRH